MTSANNSTQLNSRNERPAHMPHRGNNNNQARGCDVTLSPPPTAPLPHDVAPNTAKCSVDSTPVASAAFLAANYLLAVLQDLGQALLGEGLSQQPREPCQL